MHLHSVSFDRREVIWFKARNTSKLLDAILEVLYFIQDRDIEKAQLEFNGYNFTITQDSNVKKLINEYHEFRQEKS